MWRPSITTVVRTSERITLTNSRLLSSSVSKESQSLAQEHARFLQDVAKVETPSRLPALVEVLKLQGLELVEPQKRHGLNPFFIPVGKDVTTGQFIGFMRWPTQKEGMDLQIAATTEAGVKLVALSTDKYVARMAAESDYYGRPEADFLESIVNENGSLYKKGDSLTLLNSGRFPSQTDNDKRLVLDRYLLTKVGAFPEGYERLAEDFREKKNDVSALVTCERSSNVFYGWGHPNTYHALMLLKLNRAAEAKDTAQSSLAMPKWTLTSTIKDLDHIVTLAGYTDKKVVGDMHKIRSKDPRQKDIEEGVSPAQISLDQAAHIMDAVALGVVEGGWETVRSEIAGKYREGGYPEIATFIETAN